MADPLHKPASGKPMCDSMNSDGMCIRGKWVTQSLSGAAASTQPISLTS